MYVFIFMHIGILKYILTTKSHKYIHTCTYTQLHKYMHIYNSHSNSCMSSPSKCKSLGRADVQMACVYMYIYICIYVWIWMYIRVCRHIPTKTTHKYMHTCIYIRTYTHTLIHIYNSHNNSCMDSPSKTHSAGKQDIHMSRRHAVPPFPQGVYICIYIRI